MLGNVSLGERPVTIKVIVYFREVRNFYRNLIKECIIYVL